MTKQTMTFGRLFHPDVNDTTPGFIIRAWPYNDDAYVAEWELFSVEATSDAGAPVVGIKGGRGSGDWTENLDDAVAVAHGSVKWDGCRDFVVGEFDKKYTESDRGTLRWSVLSCMIHACGADSFGQFLDAVKAADEFARTMLKHEDA